MKTFVAAVLGFIIIAGTLTTAQAPRTLTITEKSQGIAGLATALRARYAIGELAEPAARAVEERLASTPEEARP